LTLARPGGNVTGVSSQGSDAAGKRLELLREVVPGLRRFAVLANLASSYPALELGEVQAASRTLGLEVSPFDIRRAEDIALAFEALKGHAEAVYVVADPLTSTNRIRINTLALGVRLPTMHTVREFVEAGGLMSYGQIGQANSGAQPILSTRFCAGLSLPTCQSSSRPSSIWS
jgi:putative ABC transport system substrate-binding protein